MRCGDCKYYLEGQECEPDWGDCLKGNNLFPVEPDEEACSEMRNQ